MSIINLKIDKYVSLGYRSTMKIDQELQAFAKINLHLKVLERRKDGFHGIESIFQKISLYDRILLRAEGADAFSCRIIDNSGIPEKENILYKAAKLFSDCSGFPLKVLIEMEKGIPMGSGLGGGSSDAAVLLKTLNQASGFVFTDEYLNLLASQLGSDIPFFLFNETAAFVTGKGEVVSPIDLSAAVSQPSVEYWATLIYPGFTVSTAEAYSRIDALRKKDYSRYSEKNSADLIQRSQTESVDRITSLSAGMFLLEPPGSWPFYNDFEPVICSSNPVYEKIRRELRNHNALFTSLTGSGAAYYGLFSTEDQAVRATLALRRNLTENAEAYVVKFCL
jgi:4-diphosphocytidyl-2-C-methyl-D-erythritol kinase